MVQWERLFSVSEFFARKNGFEPVSFFFLLDSRKWYNAADRKPMTLYLAIFYCFKFIRS